MKSLKFKLVQIFLFLCLYHACIVAQEKIQQAKRTYIVHMDKSNMPESFTHHSLWYDSSLKSVSDSASVLYRYENVVHGYSTMLTAEEADSLGKQPGILSVLPEVVYELHTTRTPEFLGLGKSTAFFPTSDSMGEVILGILDTGVWPELKAWASAVTLERQVRGGEKLQCIKLQQETNRCQVFFERL
ncbi:hypothetical protein V6N13_012020 [Hibiscus sabdariffa]